MSYKNTIHVIVSLWGHPFGGGEAFLYQTMKWATNLGMKVYWLCFSKPDKRVYKKFKVIQSKRGSIIHIPGGFSEEVLYYWLKLFQPESVHQQGHNRVEIINVCKKLRINIITGFHFWNDAIILNSETQNVNILKNIALHKKAPTFDTIMSNRFVYPYVVSEFVQDVINRVNETKINNIVYASSDYETIKVKNLNILKNIYITHINIHKLKGGLITLELLKNLQTVPFQLVKTEYLSEDVDSAITNEITKQNRAGVKSILLNYIEDVASLYKNTRILLIPSLVDETFCRVAVEGLMNGIPIVTTGNGFIKNLIGDAGIIIDASNTNLWIEIVNKLYHNDSLLQVYSKKSLMRYEKISDNIAISQFTSLISKTVIMSKHINIMFYAPWCDQGLGIQTRNYVDVLLNTDFNISVFSYCPYKGTSAIEMQRDPLEWKYDKINVYYSKNNRETVTDLELTTFVNEYNIGVCIIPETCWFRVFEIAKLMKKLDVRTYAIPNIEIVRKDELFKHKYFDKILCNNFICKNIFDKYNYNTAYIGYSFNDNLIRVKKKVVNNNNIKFLCIGGLNAFTRKQCKEVCEAFSVACSENSNMSLVVCVQDGQTDQLKEYLNHPSIKVISTHLSYAEILELYYDSNITIHVSKHEGLGLGFYESLATGTPVLTLNTAPHNEIIKNGVNGWLIECDHKKMEENTQSLIKSAYFETKTLANKLNELVKLCDRWKTNMYDTLILDYKKRFAKSIFLDNFRNALRFENLIG